MNDIFLTKLRELANWASRKSLWPFSCGLSCCAIEMMHAAASRYDLDQYGCLFRSSPKHADLMIVAGTITHKMAPLLKNLYDQMLAPKYVIAMGNCAISGGLFADSDTVLNGAGLLFPIDKEVTGCPPRPDELIRAILDLSSEHYNQL